MFSASATIRQTRQSPRAHGKGDAEMAQVGSKTHQKPPRWGAELINEELTHRVKKEIIFYWINMLWKY